MIVVTVALLIGVYLSTRLSERTKLLSSFISLLEEVSLRMTYISSDLASLFKDNFAGFEFSPNQPFVPQFSMMIKQYKGTLSADDIALLNDFSKGLGTSDTASQLRHIQLYVKLLQEQLNKARDEVERKSKLYRILPLSAGIAVAVLLI